MSATSSGKAALAWVTAGFTATCILFYLVGYSPVFNLPAHSPSVMGDFSRYGFFIACVACPLAMGLLDRRVERIRTSLNVAVPLLLLMGVVLYGIAPYQSLASADLLSGTGSVLIGLGYMWYLMNLYQVLASTGSITNVIVALVASRILTTLLFSCAVAITPTETHLYVAVALVVIGAVSIAAASACARRAGTAPSLLSSPGEGAKALTTKIGKRQQIAQLVLVSVVLIIMRGLSDSGIWGSGAMASHSPAALLSALGVVIVFAAISIPTFRTYVNHPIGYRYHLPFLVLIAGFFILSLTKQQLGAGSPFSALESSVELLCQMLFSFTIVNSARRLDVPGFRLSGITLSFTYLLVILWTVLMEGTGIAGNAVILVAAYVLVVFVATPTRPEAAARDRGDGAAAGMYDAIEAKGRSIAREHGLTARETEVMLLLAQGRSLPYIQEELVLAGGTVKTHVGHIYKKLDVHSKQELINLLAE